jgi:hypothetical protein
VEWESVDAATQAATEARRFGILVPAIYAGSDIGKVRSIWALTVKIDTLTDFLNSVEPFLKRLELAAPIAPVKLAFENMKGSKSQGDLLAAVLDDGCAFANERFRLQLEPGSYGSESGPGRRARLSGGNGPRSHPTDYGGQWSVDLDNVFPTGDDAG